jgi:hypothetical protein
MGPSPACRIVLTFTAPSCSICGLPQQPTRVPCPVQSRCRRPAYRGFSVADGGHSVLGSLAGSERGVHLGLRVGFRPPLCYGDPSEMTMQLRALGQQTTEDSRGLRIGAGRRDAVPSLRSASARGAAPQREEARATEAGMGRSRQIAGRRITTRIQRTQSSFVRSCQSFVPALRWASSARVFGVADSRVRCAPSEAWRFLQGERPCLIRSNQPPVPSVACPAEAERR